jgi:WhiB family redox-sensing transcriptional regulator
MMERPRSDRIRHSREVEMLRRTDPVPTVPIGAQEWRTRGACRGRNVAQFFSAEGEHKLDTQKRVARAKSVCVACPVRPECAAQALTAREEHGVWGGFTSRERKRLLALGWTDVIDQRHARVDVAELERRLRTPPTEPAPHVGSDGRPGQRYAATST